MARIEIKKLDILSVAKIYAVIFAIIGFFIGLFVAVMGTFAGAITGLGLFGASLGILAIIVFPIIYGIFGFLIGAIGAFIYNVIAEKIGGIVFESK